MTASLFDTGPECARCHKAPAERRVNPDTQRVFYLGTCSNCTDIEWSNRWKAKHAKARKEGEGNAMIRLDREKTAWISGGRRFVE